VKPCEFIVRTWFGHFSGWQEEGGWYISEFFVKPKFRGKGLARKLAAFMPRRCSLIASANCPQDGNGLDQQSLVRFYKSLGFKSGSGNEMRRKRYPREKRSKTESAPTIRTRRATYIKGM
jgi:GNAT superfamily N-acetyltransferase